MHFDSPLGNLNQKPVESEIAIDGVGSTQQVVGRDHPAGDEHLSLGIRYLIMDCLEVILPIDVVPRLAILSQGCETVKSVALQVPVLFEGHLDSQDKQAEVVPRVSFDVQNPLAGVQVDPPLVPRLGKPIGNHEVIGEQEHLFYLRVLLRMSRRVKHSFGTYGEEPLLPVGEQGHTPPAGSLIVPAS